MAWRADWLDLYKRLDRPLADPREILHGLTAAQDDAVKKQGFREDSIPPIPFNHKTGVILNPGFSRVKDLARIVTGARAIRFSSRGDCSEKKRVTVQQEDCTH